jgi:hypothetical protein
MSKQTKQIMAVAAGVLALVGLQSITVPTHSTSQSVSYSSSDDAVGGPTAERSRKRVHRHTNRYERDPVRGRERTAAAPQK